MAGKALEKRKNDWTSVAFEKNRMKLLAQMTEKTQEVAKECDILVGRAQRGNIMAMYHMGVRLADALDEKKQGEYGTNAAKQIASYVTHFDGQTNELYAAIRVSNTYDAAWIKEHAEDHVGKGYLQWGHLVALAQVAKQEDRDKLYATVVAQGLPVNEVARRIRGGEVAVKNIRAGGRKVSEPRSVISGLEKLRASALSVTNYVKMCESSVFNRIASMSVADFSPALEAKLTADKTELGSLRDHIDSADKQIDACLVRVQEGLAQKAEDAEAAEANKEAPKAPAKAPAKATKKPAKKAKDKKKANKVKAGRPAPATATV